MHIMMKTLQQIQLNYRYIAADKKNKTSFKYFQNTYSLKLTLTNSQTSQDF